MPIEGRSRESADARVRLGMVGGGEGAFIGAVHRLAARMDDHYVFVAGALSSTPEKAKRSGEALGLAADRIYGDYETMAKAEAKRPGRHRGGCDRHAERHACAGLQSVPESRHPCDLRQAADAQSEGSAVAREGGEAERPHLRPHPQLHRLSDGAARARHGGGRRAGAAPRRAGRVSAGLADGEDRGYRAQAGGVAQRSEARRRRRLPRRYRHPRVQYRQLRHRAGTGFPERRTSPAS